MLGIDVSNWLRPDANTSPLIDEELFDKVQEILESPVHSRGRRRIHHHYLKGSVYCGFCRRAGRNQRLAIQRTVNRHGQEYLYFFCRNKRDGLCLCLGPHVHVYQVEEAIERHYASIQFRPEFIEDVGAHIDTVINEQETAARLLHKQISSQLSELDTKEENLIDLAADGTLRKSRSRPSSETSKPSDGVSPTARHRERRPDRQRSAHPSGPEVA